MEDLDGFVAQNDARRNYVDHSNRGTLHHDDYQRGVVEGVGFGAFDIPDTGSGAGRCWGNVLDTSSNVCDDPCHRDCRDVQNAAGHGGRKRLRHGVPMNKILIFKEHWFLLSMVFAFMAIIVSAGAVPAGTTATAVGNNNVTFTATSAEPIAWFEYGMTPQTLVVWTQNISAGGVYTWTEIGSPLTSGETYYVAGCDNSGCDATPATFTLLDATPLPTTTYGVLYTNGTESRFNILMVIMHIPAAFTWLFPATNSAMAITIISGLVFFAIFFGLAMRTRYAAVPVLIGLISAPYLLYQNQGLGLGIPPEFTAIAQGLTYAAVAGILLLILKK
jgi:hypothetical protein